MVFRAGKGSSAAGEEGGDAAEVEKQGQVRTDCMHLAMEHDFYPESQGSPQRLQTGLGMAGVMWDWD